MNSVRASALQLADITPYDPKYLPARAYLSANENPCDVETEVRNEIKREINKVAFNRYPDPLANELRDMIAEANGLLNAHKHDSQDICFVPDGDYVGFMERYTGKYYPDGDFLDVNGKVVGRHHGAVRYTCGQRKGLGLALGAPVYVCGKDMEHNTVTVGPESELFTTTLVAGDFNWISIPELTAPMRVKAKARYRQVEQPATVYPLDNGLVKVVFDEPQRAITRGQSVVLYDGDVVVGGGTIL